MNPSNDPTGEHVVATIEGMTEAFHRGDIDAVLSAYAPGAVVAFEPGAVSRGASALREGFLSFFSVQPHFHYPGHEVLLAGDLALHIAPWVMSGTTPDGEPVQARGLSVAVLQKDAAGEWRLAIDNPYGDRLLQDQ